MSANDNIVVLNQGWTSDLRSKTSKSGAVKYHARYQAEALRFDLTEKPLAARLALALATALKQKVRDIAAQAPPATLKAREAAMKAVAAGKTWPTRRYAGGRMGARTPNQSSRAFNDSGRFAESIVASAGKDGSVRVNVAANRLSDRDSGGAERIWQRLVQLVPAFENPGLLMQENDVLAATTEAARGITQKGPMAAKPFDGWKVASEVLNILKAVGF